MRVLSVHHSERVLVAAFLLTFSAVAVPGDPITPGLLSVRDASLPQHTGGNGDSVSPRITPDARFVAFTSSASDLVTNDNGLLSTDVFLRDRRGNTTVLVSCNLSGTGGGNGHSFATGVSSNGQFVLFESEATDLVPGDTNGTTDVFVRDVWAETTHLVSRATDGGVGNWYSTESVMTPDGRYVAFISAASNLVVNDKNNGPDVFVRDLVNGTTTLASIGAVDTNSVMKTPVITPDGHWVAFFSTDRGLVSGVPTNSLGEIYLCDLVGGTTLWPSSNATALVRSVMQYSDVPVPSNPVISDDGRYVAFKSGWDDEITAPASSNTAATVVFQYDAVSNVTTVVHTNGISRYLQYGRDLGPKMTPDGMHVVFVARETSGTNYYPSVWMWNRLAGTSVPVSVDLDGGWSPNSASHSPACSADGRFVVFVSDATNLISGPVSSGTHIYRRDLLLGVTQRVDADAAGGGADTDLFGERPVLTSDGESVAFSSPDSGFFDGDNNGAEDVFVWQGSPVAHELVSRRDPSLVSVSGNAQSGMGMFSLSADGNRVAYVSPASDLVPNDTNGLPDVFVWDRTAGSNLLVSVGFDGSPASGGASGNPTIRGNGRYVFFASLATNLVVDDANSQLDLFRRDLQLNTTTLLTRDANNVSLASTETLEYSVNADGNYAVFATLTNSGLYQVYWRDLTTERTRLLPTPTVDSRTLWLSADGQRVLYSSNNGWLVVWDATLEANIFTERADDYVDISPDGRRFLFYGRSWNRQLTCYDVDADTNLITLSVSYSTEAFSPWSEDSRYFVFTTESSLIAADDNLVNDVYLCDVETGALTLISVNAAGTASGNGPSDKPAFSGDGRFIAYRSYATDLLPDPAVAPALYLFDRATESNHLITASSPVPGLDWISRPVINYSGDVLAFQSVDRDPGSGDLNRSVDVFGADTFVRPTADSDADGIPDWWLIEYFGHAEGQAGDLSRAGDDADGDGMTNLDEFNAGTIPTSYASALVVQIAHDGTAYVLQLRWEATAGQSYEVLFSDSLEPPNWQPLTGSTIEVVDHQAICWVQVTDTQRFFQVRTTK